MKSFKLQTPNFRETSSSKRKKRATGILYQALPSVPMVLRESAAPQNGKHPFDLEERTAQFGEAVIRFCKKVPRSPINDRLIDQVVGAATSIGGNYDEASEAVSKRDFRHRISTCKKEAKETKRFLRMIATSEPQLADEARELWSEGNELHLIFASIYRK